MSASPSTVKLQTRHHQHRISQHCETRNRETTRRSRMCPKRNVSCATGAVARAIPPGCVHPWTTVKTWMKLEQSRPATLGFDWEDDLVASIKSGTDRSDRTRCVKELLAFVDSGAVDSVLPKMGTQSTLCRERVTHQALRAAGLSSHNERWEQHEHHLERCRCAQAADLRQSPARERAEARIG